ncbi:MAG: hypothetical protein ACFFDW_06270 [Candidatus Thorarchaeota archaeon]
MAYIFAAFIDHWIETFSLSAVRDILLESLAIIAFIFLFVALLISMAKAPMLVKHGSIEMFGFVILGLIHSIMNLFDEFAWLTYYSEWKLAKDLVLLIGAVLLLIGFFRFFLFSARLFGIEDKSTKMEMNEDTM